MAAPVTSASTLDIRTTRCELTEARAKELFEGVLSGRTTTFDRLVLSDYAFTVEAAVVAAQAIQKLPNLTHAVLADIIASKPEAEGLAVYRALGSALKSSRLRHVDLSDNAVGTKGVDACHDILASQESLEEILFCNCGISAEGCRSIADLLLFRSPTQLRLVHFHNNMSGSGGAIAIADVVRGSPRLEDLRFSSSRCALDGVLAFAAALPSAPALRRLDLSDNTFGVRGLTALGSALSGLTRLEHINLSDTAAGDKGTAALCAALKASNAVSVLQTLGLAANEITAVGAKAVAACVRQLGALRVLDLADNELEAAGARSLARALAGRSAARPPGGTDPLAEVFLNGNSIGGGAAVAVAASVAACLPSLVALRLADNGISEGALQNVRGALAAGGKAGVLDEFEADEGADDEEEEDEDTEEDEEDVEEEEVVQREQPGPSGESNGLT
jgi:Ran GTPase-activating protein 1